MLKRNKYFTLIIFSAFITMAVNGFAQNLKLDAEKINKAYESRQKISLKVEYVMYENYTTNVVYQKNEGAMKKFGKNTYSKLEEVETINTNNYTLVVDHENESISYLPKKNAYDPYAANFLVNIDSLKKICKKVEFKKENSNQNSYNFIMHEGYPEYNEIKVFFNSSNYLVEKISLLCDEDDISIDNEEERYAKPRIEIIYKDIDTKPAFGEKEVSYEKFLVKEGNKYKTKPEYKNYELKVYALK